MHFYHEPEYEPARRFRMTGDSCIIRPQHLGVANGILTVGTPHDYVMDLSGLFAPPYASADFTFDIRILGELVPTGHWVWYPNMMFREGSLGSLHISSLLTLTAGKRNAVLSVAIENTEDCAKVLPWTIHLDGGLDYVHDWAFPVPQTPHRGTVSAEGSAILMENSTRAYAVRTSLDSLRWFAPARLWEGTTEVAAHETLCVTFSFLIGARESVREALDMDVDQAVESAYADLEKKTRSIFARLPEVHSSHTQMEAFYNRALLPLFLNVWDVEEFALRPYFSTGSVKGGCLASYLWDFAAGAKVLPMFDAAAVKAQIKAYFRVNIFKSYAILPVGGNANGPWYPVNQEKIVDMVCQYVRITGDIGFLQEEVHGKSVLQWVNENAFFGCVDGKAELIDFGTDGEDHLELRRGYPYHGILPDVNARRYETFRKAAELNRLCGQPVDALLNAAEQLKEEIAAKLWSEEHGWFWAVSEGSRYLRYTSQMFKFCDSGVLSEEMRSRLLEHLNEDEFLSEFGMHSISKLDPAYDQIDIDQGGGGSVCSFPIRIAENLYRIGRYKAADDVIRRILWWGTRMPYWGDSLVANFVDYRQDTPLQCSIGSTVGAQFVLFGIGGVKAAADGKITVCPHLPAFLEDLSIEKVHLRGKTFSIRLCKNEFCVQTENREYRMEYGQTVTLE